MKHLSPDLLAAAAEGQPLAPAQRAHLAACTECGAEVAELRALLSDLAVAPAPPKDLHQRTLQRIGLAPRTQQGWTLRWNWVLPALAAGVALVLALPAPGPKQTSQPALPLAKASGAPAQRPAEAAQPQAPVDIAKAQPAAPGAPSPAAEAPAEAAVATAPEQAASAPGMGQATAAEPREQMQVHGEDPSPKATPTHAIASLKVLTVHNNLLHPALGERVQVDLALGSAGLLTAQVLDSRGRVVAVLLRGQAGPGPLQLSWDGQDAPSGAYSLKLAFDGQHEMVKILLVR